MVVIGILIALQVNNWNNKRLERYEEIEVLNSVKKDLVNTIKELEYLNEIRASALHGAKGIFELAGNSGNKEQDLDSLIALTFYRPTFNNKEGAINLLFSSGKINLIQNDSVRERLLSWPGLIDDMVEEEQYANHVFHDHYYPLLSKYIILDDIIIKMHSNLFIGTEVQDIRYQQLPIETDYEGYLRDRKLLNHIRLRANYMRNTSGEVIDLIRKAQRLIELIDKEITI